MRAWVWTARGKALVALAGVGLAAAGAPAPSPAELRGTYRVHGTAQIAARPLLDRDVELHADAILSQGPGPRDVRAHLVAQGHACDLLARLEEGGALVFEPGQRCTVTLPSSEARGQLEASLRAGRGQMRGDHLTLELAGALTGAVSLRAGGVRVLGAEVPAVWTPAAPVQGEVRMTAEGDRDRSRAAEP